VSAKRRTTGAHRSEQPPTDQKTAREVRAAKEGWTELDLMIRSEIADTARLILNHHRRHSPQLAHLLTGSALCQMRQAVSDCRRLDDARAALGKDLKYLPQLIFNCPGAVKGIHCRSMGEYRAMTVRKTPAFQAMAVGNESIALRKRALEVIRETIRDGWEAGDALKLCSGWIREVAQKGDAAFFEELGVFLRKHRKDPIERGLTEWIVRLWLTLCLWECPADGSIAFCRFKEAARLNVFDLHNLPRLETPHFERRFTTAWKNVRAKDMKAACGA